MKLRTILTMASGLIAAGAIAAAPLTASASTVGAVAFVGATGNLNPAVNLGPNLPAQTGAFTFSTATFPGAAVCVEVQPNPTEELCVVASNDGAYTNTVCGTGTAAGTFTAGPIAGAYNIQFVAGVGVLTGSTNDGSTVAGVVDIVPTGGNCVQGVTQFTAAGVAVAA
jgi:hypothetical protein